jgi:outer membrane protein assembly factor BamB
VSKLNFLIIILILFSSCSFNKKSKFWTSPKEIKQEENLPVFEEIFPTQEALEKEFNSNLRIKLTSKTVNSTYDNNYLNNNNRVNFDGNLKKSSRYKFSKIDNFSQYQPEISFYKNNIIFFDNKGSILQFNENSKLIWKKNYYHKLEKKLKPILQFVNNGKFLVVADNIAKYYMLDIETGDLIWSKKNLAPFNSQIKIYKDKFFVIDLSNTLRCFSLKDGSELWYVNTQNSLIRTQKKLSMVIVDKKIYFNNSIGDISAVDIEKGELLWQLPTQSSLIYESAFSLKTSDIVSDKNALFFSNNKNQFFSIDISTGTLNWKQKINSDLRPTLIDNYIFTVSLEGYLIILEKNSGNIIRITDIFKKFNKKYLWEDKRLRDSIIPVGFIVGKKYVYLTTNKGRLHLIDVNTGQTDKILKIDKERISRPSVSDQNLYIIKDNSIIKLN